MPGSPQPKKRFGDQLLDAGLISSEQLDLALLEQKRSGKLLGNVLTELGFVTDQEISALLAQAAETETVDLHKLEIEPATLARVPFPLAKQLTLIPIKEDLNSITVAMADPFDVEAIDRVERLTQLMVNVVAASGREIQDLLAKAHDKSETIEKIIAELMKAERQDASGDLEEAPIIRLVNVTLHDAAERAASDVHIEPDEKTLRIRFRVDGVLQPYVMIPKDLQDNVIARVKVMAGLDVSETRLPQDGRANLTAGRKAYNLRVSTLPTSFGESVVMRILDRSSISLNIDALGMRDKDASMLEKAISLPYGMILVTGPTGSGKTTTLYTALKQVDKHERSVFTLEDPIEYHLDYTRQTQVSEKIGLTFNSGLRTLLRQDPDVILVGETRDTETAQLIVRAALTGHLVLSSMHTNDAVGAIPRMLDLGAEPSMLASTLKLIIAQRLARRICPHCRLQANDLSYYQDIIHDELPSDATIYTPNGCPECYQKGYRGRVAIFETLGIDDDIKKLIPSADIQAIAQLMRQKDMNSLFKDGLRRALAGDTSIEEVFRVANQD
ncbi:GspE/PulE family protein [Pelagicoccus sp. SDUM812003]|uniref:GspE/PulE family protein n=1 Tax=Pelagicoccus sp. SDUM812003 TaxID=3041267 RepID=UPI00280EA213|nr:GspE/PulE family protein [Pelagicoccus sp. SDUM812003]MDQ8203042.1 GspE/PulE family protein [Pelagicoccus sp. SDUM812003]